MKFLVFIKRRRKKQFVKNVERENKFRENEGILQAEIKKKYDLKMGIQK